MIFLSVLGIALIGAIGRFILYFIMPIGLSAPFVGYILVVYLVFKSSFTKGVILCFLIGLIEDMFAHSPFGLSGIQLSVSYIFAISYVKFFNIERRVEMMFYGSTIAFVGFITKLIIYIPIFKTNACLKIDLYLNQLIVIFIVGVLTIPVYSSLYRSKEKTEYLK